MTFASGMRDSVEGNENDVVGEPICPESRGAEEPPDQRFGPSWPGCERMFIPRTFALKPAKLRRLWREYARLRTPLREPPDEDCRCGDDGELLPNDRPRTEPFEGDGKRHFLRREVSLRSRAARGS